MLKKLLFAIVLTGFMVGLHAQSNQLRPVNGQVLVKLKPAVASHTFIAKFATQSRAGGGVWVDKRLSRSGNVHLMKYDTNTVSHALLMQELQQNPQVEIATTDLYVTPRTDPDDPEYEAQWGLQRINVSDVWDHTTGGLTANGDTIVVAILDTGFDIFHEDIFPNIWRNHAEVPGDGLDNDENGYVDDHWGWNFIDDSPEHIADPHGHSVAGIIGAAGNNGRGVTGINWNIKLMVLEARTISEIIAAYEYIIDQRGRYNASYGREGAFVVATNASFGINRLWCEHQPIWGEMYDRLGDVGVLTAAGTANNAWNVDEVGDMPTTCPSDFLITVLNTNPFDDRYAGSAYGRQTIDMGAPGQGSYTTKPFNRYGEFNGNSAAAPHLTGAIGLLYSLPCTQLATQALQDPEGTALRIRDVLLNGVDPLPQLAPITRTGGRLNIAQSMQFIMDDCSEPEVAVQDIEVRPNPVRTELQLRFHMEQEGTCDLVILDALGRVQYQQTMDNPPPGLYTQPIQVDRWASGAYFVLIRQNGTFMSRKFVVGHRN